MPGLGFGSGSSRGGRGGTIGEYQGQFTATTVKQRAFEANDYIVFDNGTKLEVFLAPVDIPLNSPAPGESMSLWGGLETTITSGVSRADFDAALARKANAASLTNYLRTATYNIDKARLESGITGNDNDISALQQAINNLPSEVGDVTREQLTAAVEMLEQAIGNVSGPLFVYELWASSKTTTQVRYNQGTPVDLDWTLADDVPDALAVDGDRFILPLFYRGHVNLELWHGETLIDKAVLEVESEQQSQGITQPSISGIRMGRFAWLLRQGTFNDEQVHQIEIYASDNGQVFLGGLQARVYAEVALSRSDVTVEVDGLTERIRVAETNINQLETQVDNIPVTSDVLWATSKVLSTSIPNNQRTLDTDWTLETDDVPDGVVIDSGNADRIKIPESFRGDLHIDVVDSTDNLIQRKAIQIALGEANFADVSPLGPWFRGRIIRDTTDSTLLIFDMYTSGRNRSLPTGTSIKLYGVSAVPRSQVDGVTQDQLDAAIDGINDFYIDIIPRHAKFRTSGSDPDALDGNFVFVFSHVPEEYADANVVEINFQGIQAFRGAWTPATRYIKFGFEPTSLNNLRNNTGRNQDIWQIEVTFFQGTTNLGNERSFVVIDRG